MVVHQFLQQVVSGRVFKMPALSILLAAGMATSGAAPIWAASIETATSPYQVQTQDPESVAYGQMPVSAAMMADGIYLYGQSSQPEEIGKEYLVFSVQAGKITGAIYMPSSEFTCFHGTLEPNQLNISLVNPEDNSTYSYSIALQKTTQIAQVGGRLTSPNTVTLEGYHRIASLSENDQRLLNSCQAGPTPTAQE